MFICFIYSKVTYLSLTNISLLQWLFVCSDFHAVDNKTRSYIGDRTTRSVLYLMFKSDIWGPIDNFSDIENFGIIWKGYFVNYSIKQASFYCLCKFYNFEIHG